MKENIKKGFCNLLIICGKNQFWGFAGNDKTCIFAGPKNGHYPSTPPLADSKGERFRSSAGRALHF